MTFSIHFVGFFLRVVAHSPVHLVEDVDTWRELVVPDSTKGVDLQPIESFIQNLNQMAFFVLFIKQTEDLRPPEWVLNLQVWET